MLSFGNIILLAFIFLLLFGAKKVPRIMYDLGLGVKAFKDALDGKSSFFEEDLDNSENDLLKSDNHKILNSTKEEDSKNKNVSTSKKSRNKKL